MIIIFHRPAYQPLLIFYSTLQFNEQEHSRAEGTITLNLNEWVSSQFFKRSLQSFSPSLYIAALQAFQKQLNSPILVSIHPLLYHRGTAAIFISRINSITAYLPVMVVQNNRLLRCAVTCSACLMALTLSQWIFLFPRRWLPPLLQRQGRGLLCLRRHHSGHQGKTDVVHNVSYSFQHQLWLFVGRSLFDLK